MKISCPAQRAVAEANDLYMLLQLVLPENSNVGFAFALLPPAFCLFMALTPLVGGAAPS